MKPERLLDRETNDGSSILSIAGVSLDTSMSISIGSCISLDETEKLYLFRREQASIAAEMDDSFNDNL